jgi:hypothetical protein
MQCVKLLCAAQQDLACPRFWQSYAFLKLSLAQDYCNCRLKVIGEGADDP